ncbi:hypothetical protein HYS50_00750 [Candidatus Woesearchaeota archaeon]|nr:hypothetical protein [Candidatus Woesearchaeota archaeon]
MWRYLFLLLVAGVLFSAGCAPRQVPVGSPEQLCAQAGGVWKEFPNGCVDSCELARIKNIACLQALTDGCDCGPNQCWNFAKNRCEPN